MPKVYVLWLTSVFLIACLLQTHFASAAPPSSAPVTVVNTPDQAVPTTITNSPDRANHVFASLAGSGYTVPAGMRLIVEVISLRASAPNTTGVRASMFSTLPGTNCGPGGPCGTTQFSLNVAVFNQGPSISNATFNEWAATYSVHLMSDPGSHVGCDASAGAAGNALVDCFINGYLIPAP